MTDASMAARIERLDPEVRQMFAEDAPRQVASARRKFDAGDAIAAAGEIHSLAGSAAFCGFESLRNLSSELETRLRAPAPDASAVRADLDALNIGVRDLISLMPSPK